MNNEKTREILVSRERVIKVPVEQKSNKQYIISFFILLVIIFIFFR